MEKAIGIFDSGIGGLTVAKAIHEICPNETLIYFGDTAHFPYGDKSKESIQHYADAITQFLIEKNCKAIVIACNTASAIAGNELRKKYGEIIPIFDVIVPVAEHVAQNYPDKNIGVIATKGTTNSRVYPKTINLISKNTKVNSLATPLLAPMFEEGFFNNNISKTIIQAYLSKSNLKNIDALVLACTHYPIIEKEITQLYAQNKKKISIINSAKIVALSVQKFLQNHNLEAKNKGVNEFFVSDFTSSFEKTTAIFFGEQVKLNVKDLWKK